MTISKRKMRSFFAGVMAVLFVFGSTSVTGAAVIDPNFPPQPLPPEEEQPVPECLFPPSGTIVLPTPGNPEPKSQPPSPDKLREAADKLEQKGQHEAAHTLRTVADALEVLLDSCPGSKGKGAGRPEPPCPDCTFPPDPGGVIVLPTPDNPNPQNNAQSPSQMRKQADKLDQKGKHDQAEFLREQADVIEALHSALAGDDDVDETPLFVIPEGEDLFNVQPFDVPFIIPQDFFGPGSEPFTGTVTLGGVNADTPDTTVQRLAAIELEGELPRTDVIPVEMVQLNLVSIQPITVTFNDGSQQQWNVQVDLSDGLPSSGETTITESFVGGGTFNSFFDVSVDINISPASDDFEVKILNKDGSEITVGTQYLVGEKVELKFELPSVPWTDCTSTDSDLDYCVHDVVQIRMTPPEGDAIKIDITIPQVDPVTAPPADEEPACEMAVCEPEPVDDDSGCDSSTAATDCANVDDPGLDDPTVDDPLLKDPIVTDPIFAPGTGEEYEPGLLA